MICFPVADKNPLAGIYSAIARRRMDFTPGQGWYMDEALSVGEAVRGYTLMPAIGSGTDNVLGSITPGKFADIVVLDKNIFTLDTQSIPSTAVDMTIFNGKIVYERR